jgi:glycerol kinase
MSSSVLAIDAGTTGVTALLVDERGAVLSRGHQEFPQHFPQPGWVEHDPDEIWSAVVAAATAAVRGKPAPVAVGITNQRETAVLWERSTLRAVRPAIVWQDRRTAAMCAQMRADGLEDDIAARTGLRLDPYFTGSKLRWIAANEPSVWTGVVDGSVAIGTVDSYLVARLTAGREHVTDASNASRTLLYALGGSGWDEELAGLFGVPLSALPEIRANNASFGGTDPASFLGLELPITGMAGDQQAALFGQACFAAGESKCTYGTGSFVLINTGGYAVRSGEGLLTTVAWDIGSGPVYALEGVVFVTGAAVQWLRDGLGIIDAAADIEALAASVPDSGGVVFVPALTGLAAPHWDPDARGTIVGITRGTTAAHLARATLDAITFQVRDVVDAMTRAAALPLTELAVDGGASTNDLLCQLQSDQLGVAVRRPRMTESTALGAAFLAGLGAGVWSSVDELRSSWQLDREFSPREGERDSAAHAQWGRAVERSRGWAVSS